MKIQTLIGVDGYSLLISQGSKNSYSFSIVDREIVVHSFEGIYPNSTMAIARGKSVIENLKYWQHNPSY